MFKHCVSASARPACAVRSLPQSLRRPDESSIASARDGHGTELRAVGTSRVSGRSPQPLERLGWRRASGPSAATLFVLDRSCRDRFRQPSGPTRRTSRVRRRRSNRRSAGIAGARGDPPDGSGRPRPCPTSCGPSRSRPPVVRHGAVPGRRGGGSHVAPRLAPAPAARCPPRRPGPGPSPAQPLPDRSARSARCLSVMAARFARLAAPSRNPRSTTRSPGRSTAPSEAR